MIPDKLLKVYQRKKFKWLFELRSQTHTANMPPHWNFMEKNNNSGLAIYSKKDILCDICIRRHTCSKSVSLK